MQDVRNQRWIRWLPDALRRRIENNDNLRKIAGNIGWLFWDRAVQLVLGLAVGIWMARYLGPDRFGIYRYSLAAVTFVSYVAELGLSGIVVRRIVEQTEEKDEIISTTFLLKFGAGLLTAVGVTTLVWTMRPNDSLTRIIVAIMSSKLVLQASNVVDIWFRSQVESKYAVVARNIAFAGGAGAKVVLILMQAPLVAFAWIFAGEAALLAVGLFLFYYRDGQQLHPWRFEIGRARGLLADSWPLILSGFGAAVYLKVDQIMLGEMRDVGEVGIYAVAAQISEVWYFIPTAVAASAFPVLLDIRKASTSRYENRFQLLYDVLFTGALIIAIPLSLAASWLISLLYGPQYEGAGPILAVHIWACLFVFMRSGLSKWLIAEDLFKFSLVTHGAGAIVNVILNLILIPTNGGMGAAVATVASYSTASYLALFLHPRTWPAGMMMTRAILSPARLIRHMVRG